MTAGETGHAWPCPRFYVTEDRKACTCRPDTQADGELRGEIARALTGALFTGRDYYAQADAVLALPAVQRLLAAEAAVQRVRDLIANKVHLGPNSLNELRRALDGQS